MRGSLVKKGERYYAKVYEGIDPVTGKEKVRWIATGTTKKREAEKFLTDLVKRINDGRYRTPERTTVAEYLAKWLAGQAAQVRPSTWDSYDRNVKMHVVPHVGAIPLQKLTAEDLDALYATLLRSGRRDGQGGLSVKTVRNVAVMLHKALADATRKGSVVRNVAVDADPPKLSSAKRPEMKTWTAAELTRFLEGVAELRLAPAFHVASHTGMRRGEILGVRWSDVDLDGARLSIRQAVISVAYDLQISDTKTGTGRRTIDLDPGTITVLKAWRRRQLEERLAVGPAFEDHDLVFATPTGEPIHPDSFSQAFDRAVLRSKLPKIRLHDLRHTHASVLLANNVPVKVVSERLGHATPAFTMTQYQHVMPGMQATAAATFANLISGGK